MREPGRAGLLRAGDFAHCGVALLLPRVAATAKRRQTTAAAAERTSERFKNVSPAPSLSSQHTHPDNKPDIFKSLSIARAPSQSPPFSPPPPPKAAAFCLHVCQTSCLPSPSHTLCFFFSPPAAPRQGQYRRAIAPRVAAHPPSGPRERIPRAAATLERAPQKRRSKGGAKGEGERDQKARAQEREGRPL
jgi:hypothetical protein